MIEAFKDYLSIEKLISPGDKILLGVSGGVDSLVMVELFDLTDIPFGIAHCNFKLRGTDSDLDEAFVKQLARQKKVDYFVNEFDTRTYAEENGVSIQMAARDLRFEWFKSLVNDSDYQYLATAHQIDDQIETLFVNLSRGTGIAGLHGILPKQDWIIHPLVFAYRSQIEAFAKERKLAYRTDHSNSSTKYVRNKIRHEILPLFEEINPDFRRSVHKTINRIRETEMVYNNAIAEKRNELIEVEGNRILIPISKLFELNPINTYLYELLSPFGFNSDAVADILSSLKGESGKQFLSASHLLVKDRLHLIIIKHEDYQDEIDREISILDCTVKIKQPFKLAFSKFSRTADYRIPVDPLEAHLDFDLLQFPLTLRKWNRGDYFFPLGMEGKKKLSDFFIDKKFSIFDKNETWLLCSGEDVVWVIGHRIDNRFRIQRDTKTVYKIRQIEEV